MKYIILLILCSLSIFNSCKKSDKPELSPEAKLENEQIRKDQEELRSRIKEDYKLQNASSSRDEAIKQFLKEFSQKGVQDDYKTLFSLKEFEDIILPNSLGTNALVAHTTIKKAMDMVSLRRKTGLARLYQKIGNHSFVIQSIEWRKDVRKLNTVNGHIIESIYLLIDEKQVKLDELKLVIENKGKFKLSTLGT
ncbi:MAG: hypothetical protein H7A25_07545 [Leptospiraceae bacterium]|nr:hypothetical protein [Leptospiraceae bacterium]MCP5499738.1 hypothetical protein [Leptospiraceae bacterium]